MKLIRSKNVFAYVTIFLFVVLLLSACGGDPDAVVANESLSEVISDEVISDVPTIPIPDCTTNNYQTTASQLYPSEGNVVLDLTPTFTWDFAFHCQPIGFYLRIGSLADPQSDDVFNGLTGSTALSFELSGAELLPATWHRWRLYTQLNEGAAVGDGVFVNFVTGPACEFSQLVAPTLIYPADGSFYTGKSWGNEYEVEMDIEYPGGVCLPQSYTFYISEFPDMSGPNFNVFSVGTNYSANPEGILLVEDDSNDVEDCTTYYWQAWATLDGVDGPRSEIFSFYTNIEGTCFVLPMWTDPYIVAPVNLNCRESDYAESDYLGSLRVGEEALILAVNPESTHAMIQLSSLEDSCWVLMDNVDVIHQGNVVGIGDIRDLVDIRDPFSPPTPTPTSPPPIPQCRDGIDNDGDGAIDYGTTEEIAAGTADRECSSPNDNDESQ